MNMKTYRTTGIQSDKHSDGQRDGHRVRHTFRRTYIDIQPQTLRREKRHRDGHNYSHMNIKKDRATYIQ